MPQSNKDGQRNGVRGPILPIILVAIGLFALCAWADCSQVKAQEPDIKATLVNEPEFNLVLIKTDGHFHLCGAIACADSLGFSPDKLLIVTFPDTNGVTIKKTESGKRALLAGAVIHSFLFDLEESTVREMLLRPVPTGFAIYNDAKQCLFVKITPALKKNLNLLFGYTKLVG
jgi:hypothetical protein